MTIGRSTIVQVFDACNASGSDFMACCIVGLNKNKNIAEPKNPKSSKTTSPATSS
ncbi:hypothetical protein MTR_1g090950 [Medicago truncatula]|uniref:Uncharacterized protein n=1 Tax=Medicago truncatula TaxID=3880 RepID=A0A072VN26_MEDTR|nr:hypothetical protein MTR_1g090950 [Medicago truncatula]